MYQQRWLVLGTCHLMPAPPLQVKPVTMEHILVVPRAELFAAGPLQGFSSDAATVAHFVGLVAACGRFVPRAPAEQDETLKQVVPYGVVRCAGQVFLFRRGPQGREAGLRGRRSVGLGGHVNPDDGARVGPAMLERALLRELAEEVQMDEPRPELWGVLNDDGNPVGRRHFGFVYQVWVSSPKAASREPGKIAGEFVPLARVLAGQRKMESWSRWVLAAWPRVAQGASPAGCARPGRRG
jgi:predicted NUDIX family phosphoesterase